MSRALDAPPRMTVDEFISWCETQPKGRYELHDGVVVSMSPERLGHIRMKVEAIFALRQAVRAAGLLCEAVGDGATVRIDNATAYEPDALVYCGPKLPGDALEVAPSPSSSSKSPRPRRKPTIRATSSRTISASRPSSTT